MTTFFGLSSDTNQLHTTYKPMMITNAIIDDAAAILEFYQGEEEESLSEDAVVAALADDYSLSTSNAQAAISAAYQLLDAQQASV